MNTPIKLLVGLGNPGSGYAAHRHNIDFMAIDKIADAYRFPNFAKKFQGEISEGKIGDQKIILLKPLTYMNLSGESVGACARFYKIEPHEIAVFHDELDIPLGAVKVKQGGGSGGHNGIKSIDQHIGQDYWRVRIGIGHPGSKELVTGHVLSGFIREEVSEVEKINKTIVHSLPMLINLEIKSFLGKFA